MKGCRGREVLELTRDGRDERRGIGTSGFRFRSVKREIRILALTWLSAGSQSVDLVGVVFRGGLWLDGVLRTRLYRRRSVLENGLTHAVNSSPHRGQIRVIMCPRSSLGVRVPFRPRILAEKVGLPVIVYGLRSREVEAFGMDFETAAGVVLQSRVDSQAPEPLRVAVLLARALRGL